MANLFDAFDTEANVLKTPLSVHVRKDPSASDVVIGATEQQTRVGIPNEQDLEMIDEEKMEMDEDFYSLQTEPRVNVHRLKTDGRCSHEVAVPIGKQYEPLEETDGEPVLTFPFELDTFQKEAVKCVDNYQSVLVSAHTSAGKTVVAKYVIAKALKDKQRVIYTSPIKALSNQKFRELSEDFSDVGLVTGDVTLNPNASCVVMTTEILRSMLYRGTEIMRELGWVVFDEIHYMRDKERGVVWEETIILLQDNVKYAFLSATIPNARQFAEWICYLHKQPCHVIATDRRPVPLEHFIYALGSEGLFQVVDTEGKFKQNHFERAMSSLKSEADITAAVKERGKRRSSSAAATTQVLKLIRTMKERDKLPCIIFSFSRKECENYAGLLKDIDFNTGEEKGIVGIIYDNAIDSLSEEDKKLPQISHLRPFLERGVGIHHSGLLPILKEVTEILFGEGLIKTLFATETFAMGLNMPARTVLFTSVRKFDGKNHRMITSGEYIQMSGRAGRRGKDDKGLVILMVDQQLSEDAVKKILMGQSDPLNSQFRLTYNMVLNILRVPDINPEFMLERSFYQFQNQARLPELHDKMQAKQRQLKSFHIEREQEIEAYHNLESQIKAKRDSIQARVLKPSNVAPYLQCGRLLKIKHGEHDYGWGVLIQYQKKPDPSKPLSPDLVYIVDVAVKASSDSARNINHSNNLSMLCPPRNEPGTLVIVPFTFDCICAVGQVRLKLPEVLATAEGKQALVRSLEENLKRMDNVVPEIDPIEHMKLKDEGLIKDIKYLDKLQSRHSSCKIRGLATFHDLYATYQRKLAVKEEYEQCKGEFKKCKGLLQMDELGCRKRVLRRLEYCDANDTITHKGRVACELSSADELLLSEMLFKGVFNELTPPIAAALLSCFVFEEKAPNVKLSDEMGGLMRELQSVAKKIAKVTIESKLELNEQEYLDSFSPHMMDVVSSWCNGATFAEIVKQTDIFEGSIIRCMRRLDELLNQMFDAAMSMGDQTLKEKFEAARQQLKRDIVFSASLYL